MCCYQTLGTRTREAGSAQPEGFKTWWGGHQAQDPDSKGSQVYIVIDNSLRSGMPHGRFHWISSRSINRPRQHKQVSGHTLPTLIWVAGPR